MLIIAQPKSASTSLLQSLAIFLKLKWKNGSSKDKGWKACEGFEELQKYHDTTIARSETYLKNWVNNRKVIYKDHILPTKEHIEYLKKINKPFVILLRNPEESIDNYKRLLNDYSENKLSKIEIKALKLKELSELDFDKLLKDFIAFKEGWEKAQLPKKLIVYYNDIVMNPRSSCGKICKHWGFNINSTKKYKLIRAHGNRKEYFTFTGIGLKRLQEVKNV